MRRLDFLAWTFSASVILCHVFCGVSPAAENPAPSEPAITAAQIEADWITENAVRGVPNVLRGPVTPEEDAAGGCDGVKNGRWAFHTDLEENPWWQIDLKRVIPLDQIHVYNRCDSVAHRAAELIVLLSEDGNQFNQAYQHDGTVFYGYTDGRPLVINLDGQKARYVRIQLPGRTCLHLDEACTHCRSVPERLLGKSLRWSTGRASNRDRCCWSTCIGGCPRSPAARPGDCVW